MKINCLITKEFDISDFIKWLKKQSSEYIDYWKTYSYQLIDKYITYKYPDVNCIFDSDADYIELEIDHALNSNIQH